MDMDTEMDMEMQLNQGYNDAQGYPQMTATYAAPPRSYRHRSQKYQVTEFQPKFLNEFQPMYHREEIDSPEMTTISPKRSKRNKVAVEASPSKKNVGIDLGPYLIQVGKSLLADLAPTKGEPTTRKKKRRDSTRGNSANLVSEPRRYREEPNTLPPRTPPRSGNDDDGRRDDTTTRRRGGREELKMDDEYRACRAESSGHHRSRSRRRGRDSRVRKHISVSRSDAEDDVYDGLGCDPSCSVWNCGDVDVDNDSDHYKSYGRRRGRKPRR